MTELLRNFWIKQSRPWIAVASELAWSNDLDRTESLTGIGDLGNLVAVEAVPGMTSTSFNELRDISNLLLMHGCRVGCSRQ
jgi:hypothetical protein